MTFHQVKCDTRFFRPIIDGLMTFLIKRKGNGYRVGDRLELYEFRGNYKTGCMIAVTVTYVLDMNEVNDAMDDYNALSIKRIVVPVATQPVSAFDVYGEFDAYGDRDQTESRSDG